MKKQTLLSGSIVRLRHLLHRSAELSGREKETSRIITDYLKTAAPDRIITGLGGFGVAAVYNGKAKGRTVLLRADMDALAIADDIRKPYKSRTGAAHKCGHDGHCAALCAVADALYRTPLERGRAVLLFQPAEETLAGAKAVFADPKFAALKPDMVFGLHNFPGFKTGAILLKSGVFCRATAGLTLELKGRTSHASEPEKGINPAFAAAEILLSVENLSVTIPGAKLTPVGINSGGPFFGTAPGYGTLMLTARAETQAGLDRLVSKCLAAAKKICARHGVKLKITVTDDCPETKNSPAVVAKAIRAALNLGLGTVLLPHSFATAEDFGVFTAQVPGALIGIGCGVKHPPLHSPQYDYPDQILAPSARLLETILRACV